MIQGGMTETMWFTRRDVAKLILASVAASASAFQAVPLAKAQAVRQRLPLEEFVANERLLSALRRGVAAMKKRKPSDPLSWFYQAAIHGVTDQLLCEAAR